MGLINWIKNKYYDHKLSSADKHFDKGNVDKAQQIYESLIGKQPMAETHLASMLISRSRTVNEKILVLNHVIDLGQCVMPESIPAFNAVVNQHLVDMDNMASTCFSAGQYHDAVNLLGAIKPYRKTESFKKKWHYYNAYLSFSKTHNLSLSSGLYTETISFINLIPESKTSIAQAFVKFLEQQKRYIRAISFLFQYKGNEKWISDEIVRCAIDVILGKDTERQNVKTLSDFCDSKDYNYIIADALSKLSNKKAADKDYRLAVLFDGFAAEFLSEDNKFNNDRCWHILEELSGRADGAEIKRLLDLAVTLRLSSSQISLLCRRIYEIAAASEPIKSLKICQLFTNDRSFNNVYIEKSLSLAKCGHKLNLSELRSVINKITDENTLPDVLSSFVVYIPELETEFFEAAIKKIINTKSLELVSKYWRVKANVKYLSSLISKSSGFGRDVATYIANNYNVFLTTPVFKEAYCSALSSLEDNKFTLATLEGLIKNQLGVKDFYIKTVIEYANLQSEITEALIILNRGISVVNHVRLISFKKSLINKLIGAGNFEIAEKEIASLIGKDDEAPTMLAELYFKRAESYDNYEDKRTWLYKILDVNESYQLLKRFDNNLSNTLELLSAIAISRLKDSQTDSFAIAERLEKYPAFWIPLYVTLRENEYEGCSTLNQSIKFDAETISSITSKCRNPKDFYSEEIVKIWGRYIDNNLRKSQSQPIGKAIECLCDLRNDMIQYCPKIFLDNRLSEISNLIVKLKWNQAIECEHELLFDNAILLYREIASDSVQSYVTRAELRALICHVKSNNVDVNVEERILKALSLKSYQTLREDLAYRYASYLLMNTRPEDAERILHTFLPDEAQLLNMCENIYIKAAEIKLSEFNIKAKKLNEGKMSLQEAIEFRSQIHTYKKQITEKLSDLGRPFSKFMPIVETYIVKKMFDEESYIDLLNKLVLENPNYIEHDIDFHNIAIACLGIVESNIEDEPILKRAIAVSLTAIYSDRLFVQSLAYTSWDDKYTFTLDGSFGQTSEADYDELPGNVNFDTPIDNENIAIRDVQNSLLTRLETAVRKLHPKLETFCNSEKDALDKLIELNLDKEFIVASPHLCRTLASLRMSIGNALEYELAQNYGNHEDVISLGVDYGFSGGEYDEYRKAYNSLIFCKNAVSSKPATSLSATFNSGTIGQIRKFNGLYSDLKAAISTAINDDIKSELDFRKFLDKYETICLLINDTSIVYACSNYVNGKVVHLLNEKTMKLRDGVTYMVRLYKIAPSNEQVKNNTEGVVTSLIHETEKSNISADRTALNNAIRNLNGAFSKAISLASIIAKVNNDRIEEYQALSQLYDLYTKNLQDPEICEGLATIAMVCIHKYLAGDTYTGRSEVRNVLNKLKYNKSTTFKEKARILALEYLKIMKEMPEDMRFILMTGVSLSGSTLSAKGQRLKEGLDFMKDLGDVDELLRRH